MNARALAEKVDAVPGIGPATAQIILAEIGADMSRFPTPEHLVPWAKLCPRTIQSGAKNAAGPAGQGNSWFKGALGEVANATARTDTFLGARYRRIVKRRGHAKALVTVARSILVITWHLINDPDASLRSSAQTGTNAISTPPARPATSSASSRPSATKSPSHLQPPDQTRPDIRPASGQDTAACPPEDRFSDQLQPFGNARGPLPGHAETATPRSPHPRAPTQTRPIIPLPQGHLATTAEFANGVQQGTRPPPHDPVPQDARVRPPRSRRRTPSVGRGHSDSFATADGLGPRSSPKRRSSSMEKAIPSGITGFAGSPQVSQPSLE